MPVCTIIHLEWTALPSGQEAVDLDLSCCLLVRSHVLIAVLIRTEFLGFYPCGIRRRSGDTMQGDGYTNAMFYCPS